MKFIFAVKEFDFFVFVCVMRLLMGLVLPPRPSSERWRPAGNNILGDSIRFRLAKVTRLRSLRFSFDSEKKSRGVMWEKRALCLSASNGAFKEWPCPSFSCLWPSGHKIAKELSYLGMQEELRVVILPFDSVNGVCLQKNSPHNLFKSKRPTHGQ